jgi:hypothetical protein
MLKQKCDWLAVFLLVCLAACSQSDVKQGAPTASALSSEQLYYTQFSLFQENNNFRTTNYRKGVLVPINTPLTLVSLDDDQAQVRLKETGQTLTIENVRKYTKDDMPTAFHKIAGTTKVDLGQFNKEEQESIAAGQVKNSMSKKAVLAAIGYPPRHETPNLDGSDWTYWHNRFDKFIVHFSNDKVDRIVE